MRSVLVESGRAMPWALGDGDGFVRTWCEIGRACPRVARMGPRGSWQAAVTGPRTESRTSLFQRT